MDKVSVIDEQAKNRPLTSAEAEVAELLYGRQPVPRLTPEELATRRRGQELVEGDVEATLDGELRVKKPNVPEVRYIVPYITWD